MNSDLLKQLRKEAGLTQSDMAEKLGYKHKTGYQALESGTVKTEVNTAFKIKDILKMKDEDFDAVFLDKSLAVDPYIEIPEAKPADKDTRHTARIEYFSIDYFCYCFINANMEVTHDTDNTITAYVVGCNYRHIDNAAYKSSVEGLCNIRCNNSNTVHYFYQLVLCEFFSIAGRCEIKSQLNRR